MNLRVWVILYNRQLNQITNYSEDEGKKITGYFSDINEKGGGDNFTKRMVCSEQQ